MNNNEYIPYGQHYINENDIQSVIKTLKGKFITQGPNVSKFEALFAKNVNAKYTTAVNSATSALHIACLALGLKKGDFLWTSPITFVASANCGKYCNAKVDFVDIDLSTGLISIDALQKKLQIAEIKGNLPKVLVPVHLGGASCEMKRIWELSKKYGFSVIEDASHAIGGKYYGEPVGDCRYSDACIFSLHPVKIITSAEGGILTTNNKEIDSKVKMLRSHGITKDKECFLLEDHSPWTYEQQFLGYNYRMSDIHAALGLSQLERLESIVLKRNQLRNLYENKFLNSSVQLLSIPEKIYSSNHLCIIQIEDTNDMKKKHMKIFKSLREANIGVQLHYMPVHLQPFYRNFGYKRNDFPNAEKYAEKSISLPLYPELNENNLDYIVRNLESIIKNYTD